MKLPSNTDVNTFVKPRIEKGYYLGELLEVKPRLDSNGNVKEGMYGRQSILLFKVKDKKTRETIVISNKEGPDTELILAHMLYTEWKDAKTGEYKTAITVGSKTTKVFVALGWEFGAEGVDTDKLLGKLVELNIDDYVVKVSDGEDYKASTIKDISRLDEEEEVISSSHSTEPKVIVEEKEVVVETNNEVYNEKKINLDKFLESETISQEGYDKAIINLKNQYGVK